MISLLHVWLLIECCNGIMEPWILLWLFHRHGLVLSMAVKSRKSLQRIQTGTCEYRFGTGQLTSWQHVQLQSRNETQSGPILCGKAVSIWNLGLSLPIHVCYADKSLEISTVSINMKKYASPSAFPLYCGGYVCLSVTYLLWFFFHQNWIELNFFSYITWRAK